MILKVLLISPLPPPVGGIATWTRQLLSHFKKTENLKIVHIDTAVRWRKSYETSFIKRFMGGFIQAVRLFFLVGFQLIKVRPNVVHLCSSASLATLRDIVFIIFLKIFRVKCVIHYHFGRLPNVFESKGWEWALLFLVIHLVDEIIVLDHLSEKCIKDNFHGKNCWVIPNPIPYPFEYDFAYKPESIIGRKYKISFIGNVIRDKGVFELVGACSRFNGVVQLNLIGRVAPHVVGELKDLAGPLNDEWLSFAGVVSHLDAMKALATSDLFVLPSYTEGFPNVILEAMSLGVPVIATGVGAIPDILGKEGDDRCGLLVPVRDEIALFESIKFSIENFDFVRKLGEQGRSKVQRFYANDVVMKSVFEVWFNAFNG